MFGLDILESEEVVIGCGEIKNKKGSEKSKNKKKSFSKVFICLLDCLYKKRHPHMLKFSNEEKTEFQVKLVNKKSRKWIEKDISFFKELDSVFKRERNEEAKGRFRANMLKLKSYIKEINKVKDPKDKCIIIKTYKIICPRYLDLIKKGTHSTLLEEFLENKDKRTGLKIGNSSSFAQAENPDPLSDNKEISHDVENMRNVFQSNGHCMDSTMEFEGFYTFKFDAPIQDNHLLKDQNGIERNCHAGMSYPTIYLNVSEIADCLDTRGEQSDSAENGMERNYKDVLRKDANLNDARMNSTNDFENANNSDIGGYHSDSAENCSAILMNGEGQDMNLLYENICSLDEFNKLYADGVFDNLEP